MKALNLTNTVHVHPLFFILALSAFFTGAIYEFVILFSIVAIHELGHYFTARHFGWRVTRIEFWLFGGAVVSEEHNTRPFKEQVYVVMAGPIQHLWIFALLFLLQAVNGPHTLITVAYFYNGVILLFNLLPIWPLDGGKLIFYALNQICTFRNSMTYGLLLSFSFLILIGVWFTLNDHWTLASILLGAFLITENVLEWKRKSYIYMRYLMYCSTRKVSPIPAKYVNIDPHTFVRDVLKNIRANRTHFYVLQRSPELYIVNEQECLQAYFQRKNPNLCLKDIAETVLE